MIYIRVDNEWYSTEYSARGTMPMYISGHASVIYDSELDLIMAKQVMKNNKFVELISDDQIKLELFLKADNFKEWNMDIYRFGKKE